MRRAARLGPLSVVAVLALAACGPDDTAEQGELPRHERIGQQLDTVLLRCPERVWPGADWSAAQVVLVDRGTRTAYLWSATGPRPEGATVRPLDYEAVPLDMRTSLFSFGALEGQPALSMEVGQSVGLGLVLHEGFHHFAQRSWPLEGIPSRGERYPAEGTARYLRGELTHALNRALVAPQEPWLEHAAFWQGQLVQEQPEELARSRVTDVREGSAQAFETLGFALSQEGCDADDATLGAAARRYRRVSVSNRDSESYALGQLSALLLQGQGAQGWQEVVAGGTPPVERLLQGVAPRPLAYDAAALAAEQGAAQRFNAEIAPLLAPFLTPFAQSGQVGVVVPTAWSLGSFTVTSFVSFDAPGEPGATLTRGLRAKLRTPAPAQTELAILGANAMDTRACDTHGWAVAVPASQVRWETSDRASVDSPLLAVLGSDLRAEAREDAHGRRWLCLR